VYLGLLFPSSLLYNIEEKRGAEGRKYRGLKRAKHTYDQRPCFILLTSRNNEKERRK
jgi:hypothetical protein